MEAIVLIAVFLFWAFMALLPAMLAICRSHNSALAISVLGIIGGVLAPFTIITCVLWLIALIWSLA